MVSTYMKTFIKRSLALAGFELRRKKSAFDVQRALCQKKRPVIFDVGAYLGQTVAEYRRLFPEGKIYAFEPFPEHFLFLKRSFSEDNNVKVLEQALSDYPYPAKAGCPTVAGGRWTRAAPAGMAPAVSWS
jgi:tRNA G46 methylase TrmB